MLTIRRRISNTETPKAQAIETTNTTIHTVREMFPVGDTTADMAFKNSLSLERDPAPRFPPSQYKMPETRPA